VLCTSAYVAPVRNVVEALMYAVAHSRGRSLVLMPNICQSSSCCHFLTFRLHLARVQVTMAPAAHGRPACRLMLSAMLTAAMGWTRSGARTSAAQGSLAPVAAAQHRQQGTKPHPVMRSSSSSVPPQPRVGCCTMRATATMGLWRTRGWWAAHAAVGAGKCRQSTRHQPRHSHMHVLRRQR
jgi:hypothetical protein